MLLENYDVIRLHALAERALVDAVVAKCDRADCQITFRDLGGTMMGAGAPWLDKSGAYHSADPNTRSVEASCSACGSKIEKPVCEDKVRWDAK